MDEADSVTGLTGRQKEAVQESWNTISAQWKVFGPEFFVRLFTEYPAIRAFFKTLDGLSLEEMKTAPKLKAHTINFKMGLRGWVENLDDPECLVELIKKLTVNHFKRKISADRFQEALDLFLKFADEKLELDDFTKESWQKTSAVIVSVISDHMDTMGADEK